MENLLMLLLFFVAIAFIVVATSKFKLHPFISLLIATVFVALLGGLDIVTFEKVIRDGFGTILANIGIVIVLGTVIGVILEKSGAAVKMADVILKVVGPKRPALAMAIIGWIVSIPVFCDSGYVILSSLRKSVTRRSRASAVTMSIALATGLFASHTLVPPTPGPIAAAGNLGLANNLGLVIVMGLLVSIVTMFAGLAWAKVSGRKYKIEEDYENERLYESGMSLDEDLVEKTYGKLPNGFLAFAPILVPILLIALGTVANFPTLPFGPKDEKLFMYIFAIGQPMNALIVGLGFAFLLLPKYNEETLSKWIGEGISQAGPIILITGIGGAFGAVIKATPIIDILKDSLSGLGIGLLVPFILAAALKTAQGSSTTALVTTSAVMGALLAPLGLNTQMGAVLTVMAIGAGALTVSHSNDSYFWVVTQFSGMDVKTAYKTHTVATLIQGIVTILFVLLLSIFLL